MRTIPACSPAWPGRAGNREPPGAELAAAELADLHVLLHAEATTGANADALRARHSGFRRNLEGCAITIRHHAHEQAGHVLRQIDLFLLPVALAGYAPAEFAILDLALH